MKIAFTYLILLFTSGVLFSQIQVSTDISAEQVIEDVFLSNGVFISNISSVVIPGFVGTFQNTNSNLGLENGIILGTSDVHFVSGEEELQVSDDGSLIYYDDPDLLYVTSVASIHDPSVLEFDFIATGDSVDFQFVFGSTEYPDWVGSGFSDGFGFFLSGPGINGPFSNGAVNLAIVPGTGEPININTINNVDNNEYYVNNPFSNEPEYVNCGGGFTTVLHASWGNMLVGEVYHIKLAVCDAGDAVLGTYVFLSGDSFVQFCDDSSELLPDQCYLCTLDAEVGYIDECMSIELTNLSDINIEYTDCYYEMGDGQYADACSGTTLYTYAAEGNYTVKLVYEVGDFTSKIEIVDLAIAESLPPIPSIETVGETLVASNASNQWLIQWYLFGVAIEGANNEVLENPQEGSYTVTYTNTCGTVVSNEIVNSVGEWQGSQGANIYPNPGNGNFRVTGLISGRIEIYNMLGTLVMQSGITNIGSEICTLLAPGIYQVKISGMDGILISSQKLVVE